MDEQRISQSVIRANRISFASGIKSGGGQFTVEARWGHASVSLGKKVYVFGGQGESLMSTFCVYDCTNSIWSEVHTLGKGPSARHGHTATLVEDGETPKIMIFGGKNNKKSLNDLFCLSLPTMSWSTFHFDKVQPDSRAAHTCTFVPAIPGKTASNRMILFAGFHSHKYLNSLYSLEFPRLQNDTIRWIKPTTRGSTPSVRSGHSMSLISKESGILVLFGGFDGKRSLNDVHTLNCSSSDVLEWNKVQTSGISPVARHGHTAVVVNSRYLVIHGGCSETTFLNDVHILDLTTWNWTQPHVAGIPLFPRLFHSANLMDSGEMVVFGGCSSGRLYSDMCELDLKFLFPIGHFNQSLSSSSSSLSSSSQSNVNNLNLPSPQQLHIQSNNNNNVNNNHNNNNNNNNNNNINNITSTTTTTNTNNYNNNISSPSSPLSTSSSSSSENGVFSTISTTSTISTPPPILPNLHNSIELESQLSHARSLLVSEQRQKTILSNELQMTKQAQTSAIQSIIEEQTRYEELEKALSKLELSYKKEQTEKVKSKDMITKLSLSLKEKDLQIQNLQQQAVTVNQVKIHTNNIMQQLSSNGADDQHTSASRVKELERQIEQMKKDNQSLVTTVKESQQKGRDLEELNSHLRLRFGLSNQTIKIDHLLGQGLTSLSDSDLDKIEHYHQEQLKRTTKIRAQQEAIRLQKESSMCIVCAERPVSIILLPCAHRCLFESPFNDKSHGLTKFRTI
ncbi:RING zinc finger-containing protein [Cavenderia fasciculata]|uniref:RING zinc finger-containing protein n=1 Tax=Cavenderia fasciculata TaxID=261658 RepID=F4PW96_CACFS|nr:RING zinc finger-containing protein [Cavenderia fasciculata]EGG20260.1 RING zinc finger-containing protein [Cavenderia fasciculata]|eukprot:XP_004367243.1 RING zinc finger-containing protein [Cavenderia fasciculata]